MDATRLTLDEFETLLETYGSDPGRWPVLRRAEALALVGDSAAAARLLAEARALDGVLARSGKPDPARLQPMADIIFAAAMTAAVAAPDTQSKGARIIQLPVRKRLPETLPAAPWPVRRETSRPAREPETWRAATALAASLMLGVMLGIADLAPTSAFGFGPATEASTGDAELVLSALHGSGLQTLDEDEQ